VLERGPVRGARGHLETGVATALTYGLRIAEGSEAAARAMQIAEQLGDELLWAGAAQAYGWHRIVAGELRDGLHTVERGFQAADRGQRSFLAWMGSVMCGQMTWGLGDPARAQTFLERTLGLPYVGKTAYRQQTVDGIGRCHASRGEMTQARLLLCDAKPTWITHSLKPLLDLWEGNWEAVDALARRTLQTSRRSGNRWDEWASCHLAAQVCALRGETERAGELLERALAIVVDGGACYFEMWVGPDLARAYARTGRLEEARAQVQRSRQIVAADEDWRGRGGHADLAEAVVLAAEGRTDEADARVAAAVATMRRYELCGDAADALHEWGRALVGAGDRSGAAEKLDAALEIYERHGAGPRLLERVKAARPA
jgi:tetratricopeptide (TPR) repeat protein